MDVLKKIIEFTAHVELLKNNLDVLKNEIVKQGKSKICIGFFKIGL